MECIFFRPCTISSNHQDKVRPASSVLKGHPAMYPFTHKFHCYCIFCKAHMSEVSQDCASTWKVVGTYLVRFIIPIGHIYIYI